jgi:putative transposase
VSVDPCIEAERAQQRNLTRVGQLLKVSRAASYPAGPAAPGPTSRLPSSAPSTSGPPTPRPRAARALPAATPSCAGPATGTAARASPGCCGPRGGPGAGRAASGHHDPRLAGCGACGADPRRLQGARGGGQPELARRPHLQLDLGGLAVAGHRDRHRRPPRRGVGLGRAPAHQLVAEALQRGRRARSRSRGRLSCGSRRPLPQSGLRHPGRRLEVVLSHGRTGQCWDNALAESLVAWLQGECLSEQPWPTRAAARRAVVEYIGWCNGVRLPSALAT